MLGWTGDHADAEQYFESVLRENPRYLTARVWLAFMQAALGDSQAAATQLEFSERLAGEERLLVINCR